MANLSDSELTKLLSEDGVIATCNAKKLKKFIIANITYHKIENNLSDFDLQSQLKINNDDYYKLMNHNDLNDSILTLCQVCHILKLNLEIS